MPGAAWFHKTITSGWWSVIWHIFKNKWDKIFQLQTNLTSFYPEPSICLNCSATNYPRSRELPQRITKRCLLREIKCWSDSHSESTWRKKKKKKKTNSQQMRHWCLVLCLQRSLLYCVHQDFFGSCFLKICVCLLHNTWCNRKKIKPTRTVLWGVGNFRSVEQWQLMHVFSTSERFN